MKVVLPKQKSTWLYFFCVLSSPLYAQDFFKPPKDYPDQKLVPLGGEDCDHKDIELIFKPRVHFRGVWGDSDLYDSGLEHGGHDPIHNGWSIPSASLGMDITYGEHFSAFAEGILLWNNEDDWDAELEELYIRIQNLPGGLDLKAGKMLAFAGTQNTLHTHVWNFVDASLPGVRFLGDDGLGIEGVELTWHLPTRWDDRLVVSYGKAIEHEHEDDDGDEHEDEHNHNEEAEEALWDEDILTMRYVASFWPKDHYRLIYGASYVQGKNFMGHRSRLYGLDFTYHWQEDKQQLTWRNEVMMRDVDTDEGNFNELAFSSEILWKLSPLWQLGLRYDYLEGVDDPELPERHRISPAITRYIKMGDIDSLIRLQYNYDHSQERGNDHSIWFEMSFEWGGGNDGHAH